MGSIDDIMQLCRLCLVKDQVNIPIFDETSDIRQTFLKINQCLPVKVSRDDNLPKKICDDCSYKLDMLYVFRNTSVDSEKQLMSWLSQAGLDSCSLSQSVKDGVTKPEIMVKQETFEASDVRLESENPELNADAHQELGVDAHSYIMQQQKLPYQQDFAAAFGEPSGSNEEPPPKRAKRAAATKKQVPLETEVEEALDTAMQITKAEEEDSDDVDQPDYVEAPSTSADDQPGPSGVGKIDAPLKIERSDPEPFKCPLCFKTCKSAISFRKHRKYHNEKKYKCPQCPKMFTNAKLKIHLASSFHNNIRNFVCDICNKTFTLKTNLKIHVTSCHTKDYQFVCEVCKKGFCKKAALAQHKRVKHEGQYYICKHCSKEFATKDSYRVHVQSRHSNDRHLKVCSICSKTFRSTKGYDAHMKRHSGYKEEHVCDVCGKSMSSSSSLYNHKKIHTEVKSFVCEVCGRCFRHKQELKSHSVVHTKEKPFGCNLCEKKFAQKTGLIIHIRYHHTEEKPYKCEKCSKQFVTVTRFKKHNCTKIA